jgi:hypothetical protein
MGTTATSGLYSNPATWVGGVVPANTNAFVVAAGHTLTYDGGTRTLGNDSASAFTVNGTLRFSRSVSSDLTIRGTITIGGTGTLDMGTDADPITAVTAVLRLNDSATMAAGKYSLTKNAGGRIFMRGVQRTRRTTLVSACASGATSIQVDAASNWQIGDILLLIPTEASATPATAIQRVTIAAGYTPGSTTVLISAGSAVARASGGFVANLSSNVRVIETNSGFGTTFGANTDNDANGVIIRDVEFAMNGTGTQGVMRFGSTPAPGGYRAIVDRCAFYQLTAANVSPYVRVAFGCLLRDCVMAGLGNSPLGRAGADTDGCLFVLPGNAAEIAGQNNLAARAGPSRNCIVVSGATVIVSNVLSFFGDMSACTYVVASNASNINGAVILTAPGLTWRGCDLAYTATARPAFSTGQESSGRTTFIDCRVPDTDPTITWGNFPGLEVILQDCYRRSTPSVRFTEFYANGGQGASLGSLRKNGRASFAITQRAAGFPIEYTFAANIGAGQTRTILVNLRRDATYGAGSMPRVTLTIAGQSPVSSAAPDVVDTWHEQSVSITNAAGTAQELLITLTCDGAVNGTAYFDGLPVAPFVTGARWYGYEFDQTNPFRVVDPTITLTEAAAAAIAGVAINHTAQMITVTAARTAAEIYCFAMLDLVNNLDGSGNYRTRHITSSDGASFATSYTVVISGAGSIAGRYSDANGAVVSASVTGIVPGSRILIRRTDTNAVLLNTIVAGTTASFNVQTAVAIPIAVVVRKATAAPFFQEWNAVGSIDPVGGFAAVANQQPD